MNRYKVERTIRTTVEVGVSLLSAYVMLRIVLGPDAVNRVRMRGYRVVARTANKQSEFWGSIAANANTAYHRARNVSV